MVGNIVVYLWARFRLANFRKRWILVLRTKKTVVLLCFLSWGQNKHWFYCFFCVFGAGDNKTIGFTVFSELGTKKPLEILWFRDCVALGQIKRCCFVLSSENTVKPVVCLSWAPKTQNKTIKKTRFVCPKTTKSRKHCISSVFFCHGLRKHCKTSVFLSRAQKTQ